MTSQSSSSISPRDVFDTVNSRCKLCWKRMCCGAATWGVTSTASLIRTDCSRKLHQCTTTTTTLLFALCLAVLPNTCTAPLNPTSGCFAHCCHRYFTSISINWPGPWRAGSAHPVLTQVAALISTPLFRSLLFLLFSISLVTESHSPWQGVKPQTMVVVSVGICFPHAPPLFLLSPLSLIKRPLSHSIQSWDNGPCPALCCPAQGQMGGLTTNTLRRG